MPLTQEQTTDLVRRIVETVRPLRIILFGSAARGDDSPRSDVDVLVVMPDGTHRRETARRIYRGLSGFIAPVDVVVATISDMENYRDSPGLIYREALRNGRVLYAA